MRKLLSLVTAGLLVIGASGCQSDQEAQTSATESSTSTSTPAETGIAAPSGEAAIKLINASHLAMEQDGLSEIVVSGDQRFALVYDPSKSEYQAAMQNLVSNEAELIFEKDNFSIFYMYLMLEVQGVAIDVFQESYIISAPEWGAIEFFSFGGLIDRAQGPSASWQATFSYEVDPELDIMLQSTTLEYLKTLSN
jgi:hypothetical protein